MMKVKPKKCRYHSLTGRITPKIVAKAYKNVKRNRGAAGIDKQSIKMFAKDTETLNRNLETIMKALKSGIYKAIPLKRVYIKKENGKLRPLGIPTVKCRIAQEIIRLIINPIFERIFHKSGSRL